MGSDLAADPWGAALLATGGLAGLALVWLFVARSAGGTGKTAGWISGIALTGFIASAFVGAAAGVPVADAGGAEADANAQAQPTEIKAVPVVGEPTPEPEPPGRIASEIPAPPPLPTEQGARDKAVRTILRDGKRIASTKRSCRDPQRVGEAWSRLAAVPSDVMPRRVEIIAKRLEECRRKLTFTTAYAIRTRRIDERKDFADGLRQRLKPHNVKVMATLSGVRRQKLRIGGRGMTPEKAQALLASGFKVELEGLGFEEVTFADGKRTHRESLAPTRDSELVKNRLARYGLADRLVLRDAG